MISRAPPACRKYQLLGFTLLLGVLAIVFVVMDPSNPDGASALVGGERELITMQAWHESPHGCPPTCGTMRCCQKAAEKAAGGKAQGASAPAPSQAPAPAPAPAAAAADNKKVDNKKLDDLQQQLKAKDDEVNDLLSKMKTNAVSGEQSAELSKVKQELEDTKQQLAQATKDKADMQAKIGAATKAGQDAANKAKADAQKEKADAAKVTQEKQVAAAEHKAEALKAEYQKMHTAALAAVKAVKDKAAVVAADPKSTIQDIEAAQQGIDAADKVFSRTKLEKAQVEGAEQTAQVLAPRPAGPAATPGK